MREMPDPSRELLWGNEVVIEPAHLRSGHFVSRMDQPWIGTPFPLVGVLISKQSQLDWMRTHCQWVVVDLLRSENRRIPAGHSSELSAGSDKGDWHGDLSDDQASINMLRRAGIDEEIVEASFEMHELLHHQADELISTISAGGQIDAEKARNSVSGLADKLEKNIAAMVWLTRIKHADQYTAQHCVNVAILSMGLATALEWQREQIELVGLAGMLHDLAEYNAGRQGNTLRVAEVLPDDALEVELDQVLREQGASALRRDGENPAVH